MSATKRPANPSTVISGNVVRCTLPDAVRDFEEGAVGEEGEEIDRAGRVVSYRRDASAAVARSAHCRVLAQISDHDADTDTATETFILDISPARAAFGDPGWIAS